MHVHIHVSTPEISNRWLCAGIQVLVLKTKTAQKEREREREK